tara:strand:+ start:234 stop:395 length:162 start_codon:yes stop_codon:yes gene_type:complete
MKLSRVHFIAIAKTIALLSKDCTRRDVALAFASLFQQSNPRFDVLKFVDACDV